MPNKRKFFFCFFVASPNHHEFIGILFSQMKKIPKKKNIPEKKKKKYFSKWNPYEISNLVTLIQLHTYNNTFSCMCIHIWSCLRLKCLLICFPLIISQRYHNEKMINYVKRFNWIAIGQKKIKVEYIFSERLEIINVYNITLIHTLTLCQGYSLAFSYYNKLL